ncbi:MAG: hypothetical protein QM739_01195 [Propionivibrio sp.]
MKHEIDAGIGHWEQDDLSMGVALGCAGGGDSQCWWRCNVTSGERSWTNLSGSADWFTAGSWSAGVPTLADEASLSAARIIRITSTNQVATAGLLNINSGGLDIAKGTLQSCWRVARKRRFAFVDWGKRLVRSAFRINSGGDLCRQCFERGDTGRQQRQH